MEEFVHYGELYDLYQKLLTEKQRNYFEDYYFHNLSLGEMAENYGVSRNAIFRQLHIVTSKLEEYEEILHLFFKKQKLIDVLQSKQIDDIKKQIEEVL